MLKLIIIFLIFLTTKCFKTKGIDVSQWQGGDIDFKKVKKAGYTFVIIRAGTGSAEKDIYFERNYRKAKEAGLNVGTYWYSYSSTAEGGIPEAKFALEVIKGKKFEYPFFYDVEENDITKRGITSQLAENFCTILESNGYFCGLYASKYYLETFFSDRIRDKYTIWVAQYFNQCTYKGNYGIWQRTADGRVPGIKDTVDIDISYIDYPSIMLKMHLNGFWEGGVYKGGNNNESNIFYRYLYILIFLLTII